MRRLIGDQRGMTLMEVMLAVAILGVGLGALSQAIPIASYGIQEGNQLSTATFLANQRLEQVRNARWQAIPTCVDTLGASPSPTQPPAGTCPGSTGSTFPDENPVAAPYTGYSRSVRITACGGGAGCNGIVDNDLRQVTVTVTYRAMSGIGMSAAGTTKASTVTTYISSR